jgi:hypothetical protein
LSLACQAWCTTKKELEPLLETHTFERLSRFKSEEFTRKNIVYELSSSIGLNALSEEQLNSWMHEAFIRTSELGIKLDINTDIPGSPLLVIHGTFVTSISQIIPIQMMLIDLALLTPTALWVTEILNDQETIINYTTLSKTHLLWRKVSSEQN